MINRFVEESLTLDVFIIGYRSLGESILLVVKSDRVVCFTCVIDCYEYNGINKTIEILNNLNILYVDIVCWTHPDIDHSIGIDKILLKYANENTTVLIPEGLDGDRESYDYDKRVKETFEMINDNIKSNKHSSFSTTSVSDSKILTFESYVYTKEDRVFDFDVKSVAPSSYLIRRREQYTSEPSKNDYSIALHVKFGNLELFFGGDIENVNIDLMKNCSHIYLPNSFHLLKIPHHTSYSSNNLLELLNRSNKTSTVCSTVYRSSKLPHPGLIDLYREYSNQFLCTGCITGQEDKEDFGYIHITYDLLQNNRTTNYYGNAKEIFGSFVEPLQTPKN